MKKALEVGEKVSRVERLHQDPPVADWDGTTAWAPSRVNGERVMLECAVVPCPSCGGKGFWARGYVACLGCETRQQLKG